MGNKRCKRCIMPAEYPGITFDSEGVCSHCNQHERNTANSKTKSSGKDKLLELIGSGKKAGKYDCVVPLSGGKDSVYVLYYSVKELGLRPIAVTYNSGFQTPIAMGNVQNACDALNVPCVIKKANKNIQDRLLRESLRISETIGSFVRTCINCSTLIKAIPIKVAKQRQIPFVLWGDSVRESVRLVKMRSKLKTAKYEDIKSNRLTTIVIEKVSKLREANMTPYKFIRIFPRLIRYRLLSLYQLLSLGVPLKHAFFPNIGFAFPKKGPQLIHFFDYVDWDPVEGTAVLERELNWKHPPNRKSRFDCCLYCFANHEVLQADGISADGVIDCNLIREGLLSREEVLEAEQLRERTVLEECKRVVSKLGLDDFVLPALRTGTKGH
jgi:3'-phosphoadenosine 5'-phosphosulfate sulfotransferase (PAPS reductase)/FAD synthetase